MNDKVIEAVLLYFRETSGLKAFAFVLVRVYYEVRTYIIGIRNEY
jgi:hypothetical protein